MYSNVEPGGYEFENTTGDGGKNGSFIDEGLWEGGRVPIGSPATDELWQQTPSLTGQRNWQMATLNLGKRRCVWQDVRARCQVEGCSEELGSGKEYYRRHKVCDAHSKSPRVSMLGIHQRFCQQCSRFHSLAEFDAAKRSCRRRLAGHNERRRKSSSQHQERIFPSHAPSLLSSNASSWPPSSISDMSSAALQELIEENRVAVSGRHCLQQRILDPNRH